MLPFVVNMSYVYSKYTLESVLESNWINIPSLRWPRMQCVWGAFSEGEVVNPSLSWEVHWEPVTGSQCCADCREGWCVLRAPVSYPMSLGGKYLLLSVISIKRKFILWCSYHTGIKWYAFFKFFGFIWIIKHYVININYYNYNWHLRNHELV